MSSNICFLFTLGPCGALATHVQHIPTRANQYQLVPTHANQSQTVQTDPNLPTTGGTLRKCLSKLKEKNRVQKYKI